MRHTYLSLILLSLLLPSFSYAETPKPDFFDTAMKSQSGMDSLTDAQKTELKAYLSASALEAPGVVVSIDSLDVSLDKPAYTKGDPIIVSLSINAPILKGYADTHQDTKDAPSLFMNLSLKDAKGVSCLSSTDRTLPITDLNPTFTLSAEDTCDHPQATLSLSDWNKTALGSWEIKTPRIVPFVEKPATHEASQDTAQTAPADQASTPTQDQGGTFAKAGIIIVIVILFLASLGLIGWRVIGKRQ